jgi:hypothetical protein
LEIKRRTAVFLLLSVAALLAFAVVASPLSAQLLLDDPLQGSTSGVRDGGAFVSGGWQVTTDYDSIFWHLPHTVSKGAAEFYVTGVGSTYPHKTEYFHMYDYNFGNSDYAYTGGYRDNPYKHFLRKTGTDDPARNGSCEIVYAITPNYYELDTAVLPWSPSANYKMRLEWGPDGGNSRLNVFRDGSLILSEDLPGTYSPTGHSVRIGCSPRRAMEGSEIGAKFSYLKVWDMTNNIPSPPVVTTPSSGETMKSSLAFIKWSGDPHDSYQVRVCLQNNPDAGIAWDSGQVTSARNWAWTGTLSNLSNYYVFVRLGSSSGWSGWSAAGYWFRVDNSYNASNNVLVQGNSLRDANGPFLGVGFTYMRSLQRCKWDRSRWHSDMAAMSSMGFNYQRILSEVDWAGLEIAPVTFPSGFPAWPDYWTQFDYDIDTAFDTYGIRTEVTIFASDGTFANNAAKYAHVDNILAHCNARAEKIIQIEVVNEGWQNGFPDETVTRDFCQYMAERTSIPVSITCPVDRSDPAIVAMYSSGPADISTVHFDRDLGSANGHWGPVIDCWRVPNLYPGVPPCSSNEPIGSGSSVSTEDHPNHLAAAGAFAWIANLPMYVYHGRAGTTAIDAGNGQPVAFEQTAGFAAYRYMQDIIPGDVASWIRNDGKESSAPFTAYCNGQANKYWTDVAGASSGCHRNIGGRKGIEFICFTQGVLGGGVTLEARQQLTFKVYNPLTGAIVVDTTTKNTGQQITLPMGNEIYIIKGAYGPSLPSGGGKTLTSRAQQGALTIDGDSADWNLTEFTTKVRGGQSGAGDTALIGFDGGQCYYGSYWLGGALPTSAADHTAKVYTRNSTSYLYFLVRCDDNDIRYNHPTSDNWMNDCVEFYIDPSHDHGATAISSSTSDIQLVIDADNQKNVYMTTPGYATQILAGVTSAVARDATGWWLEVGISKSALDPDVPTNSAVGMDFNFRDNDGDNSASLTTVYNWADSTPDGESKVPSMWGDCFLDAWQGPYAGVISLPGVIQAENYDIGGQNISFYDLTAGNACGVFRNDEIDICDATDAGGGYCIGMIDAGEWAEYTVNVASTGDYSLKLRVASALSGGSFRVLMDGTDVTGVRSLAGTGGWQNWTTVTVPTRYLTAGQHIMRLQMETAGFNVNYVQVDSNGVDAVSTDLGSPDFEDGVSHISGGDGDTVPWTIGGHNCRENATVEDNYMYFNVADAYAFQGSKPNLYVTIDYYDLGTGTIGLNYDATASMWTTQEGPTLTNSLTWKSYTFHLSDAYFGNRENYGADFRIYGPGGGAEFAIDTVSVYSAPPDAVPPGNVSVFTATPGDLANNLSWTNPSDPDLTGVKIMFKTTGYPTGPADGSTAYDGPGTSALHIGLTNGTTYYYKAFAHDATPNYASGVQASARPADAGPPANVTSFAAASGDRQITLSWTNPASGSTGTKIMFKTTGYPSSVTDGTQCFNGAGTTYIHTGLTNGTRYYYKAFSHDEIPNYASGAQANAVPAGAVTIGSSSFDSDGNGWALTTWKFSSDPTVIPQMVWTGGVGNPGGAVRSIGAGQTDNNDRCLREGGEMAKVISTVGYHDIQFSYDLRVSALGGDYTGAGGGGSCAVDHGVVDEQLTVFYSTNGGATWTEAEYLLRAALLGYQSYGRRTVNLSAIPEANEKPGFALRFRWQLNHTSDIVDIDNVTVTGFSSAPVDTTPPGPITDAKAYGGNGQISLSWTNPSDGDFAGTMVRFKTTGYPTSATDGNQCYNGTATSFIHTSLVNGTKYYYSAFALDAVPNYSAPANTSATPAVDATIPAAKGLADTQVRALRGNVVSAVFTDGFYIQDPNHPWGIRATGASASLGQKVDVIGTLRGQNAERYIDCTGNAVAVIDQGPIALDAAAVGGSAVGGAVLNAYSPGVLAGQGPNNLGLLVSVFGKVTQRDRSLQFFYVDDGSRRSDGTQTETSVGVWEPSVGLRIKADPSAYPKDSYLAVTGISSCFADGGVLKALVLPRTGGIQTLRQ